nr:hypothetical protein [Alicyclobacillus mengziensis]
MTLDDPSQAHSERYHCCATCVHYCAKRTDAGVHTYCSRLGYDTRPNWKFHCWTPKEHIIQRLKAKQFSNDVTSEK